jgi:uncharacterized protein involved in response to NO
MSTTAEQMRAWRGPVLLTYGFRSFFLGAGVWAVVAMLLWIPMLSGFALLPTAFDPGTRTNSSATAPFAAITAAALVIAGALHVWRLARWAGHRTGAEPLVLVVHAGYALVPLGALAVASAILWPGAIGMAAAQHVWTAGALGLMTLAVMTRATLGHTGHTLTAGAGTVAIYLLLAMSIAARFLAGPMPVLAPTLHALSGLAWIGAFGSFSVLYGRHLLRAKPER